MVADLARGEIVLIIEGAPAGSQERSGAELDRVLGILLPELSLKQAATLAARLTGCRDNEVYRRALQLRQANEMD